MNFAVYSANKWNELAARVRAAWPFPGRASRLGYRSRGVTVEADPGFDGWRHPWTVDCTFEHYQDESGKLVGEWRARITPGFMNGRDAFISMPAKWPDEYKGRGSDAADRPLTDEPAPFLSLNNWRNPLLPRDVSSSTGEIVFGPAEGYPSFFETLGVKPAPKGGRLNSLFKDDFDAFRTREIRAMDIYLTKPRLASSIQVEVLNPLAGDNYTSLLSTTYSDDYYKLHSGRTRLAAVSKWENPDLRPADPLASPLLGLPLPGTDDDARDERKLATVWIVSQPGADRESEPDETWTAYPKHDVFWNLWHATQFTPPLNLRLDPLEIHTGLAAGLLDTLGNAMLAPINSELDEVRQFLTSSDMRGRFWTL